MTESFRRNQLEWALWQLFAGNTPAEDPPKVFRNRIKRLLDIDRDLGPRDDLTFDRPGWFEHVGNEHRAIRSGVALIDQTSFSKFEVKGPGALEALQWVAANNIDRPVGSLICARSAPQAAC